MRPLRIGTRGSLLARTQSEWVGARLAERTGRSIELVILSTRGDEIRDRPLAEVGGKGLFTAELEQALREHSIDLAVHSMKDMPTEEAPGLQLFAVPEREDPRDAMVGARLADLPAGAVVGTGSARRAGQLRAARPDLVVKGIRGNVPTRIRKQREGEYDAVVLAAAGLRRLGLAHEAAEVLEVDLMVPAAGQGALAVQCRLHDPEIEAVLGTVHHADTAAAVQIERAFLREFGGGCSAPVACYVRTSELGVSILAYCEVGGEPRRALVNGPLAEGERLAVELARSF